MVRIAIVDDQERDARLLGQALDRYAAERGVALEHSWLPSATDFLAGYRHQYEIVFMDIRMPGLDGMSAARSLRQIDQGVALVFLTSLAQYAVDGYELDAVDYILKPVSYEALKLKLPRVLARCPSPQQEVVVQSGGKSTRLLPDEIEFVEIYDHHIQFVTTRGTVRAYGTLKEIEQQLPEGFFRVNNQTIVNLRHVRGVEGQDVAVGGRRFSISRGRRKEFLEALQRAYSAR